jgi:hypothetical protein
MGKKEVKSVMKLITSGSAPAARSWAIAITSNRLSRASVTVHDRTETLFTISLKQASTIARMRIWAISGGRTVNRGAHQLAAS